MTPERILLDVKLSGANGSDVLKLIRDTWPSADVTLLNREESSTGAFPGTSPRTLREMERVQIKAALEAMGGHRGNAAKILGISERNLHRKIRAYRLDK